MIWSFILFPALAVTPATQTWDDVANAHGPSGLHWVRELRFTWSHVPSGKTRSYDWNRTTDTVSAVLTPGAEPVRFPASGEGLPPSASDAHQAFINDVYWLLFEHKGATDDAARSDVPAVGPFPDAVGAYEVRYTTTKGYTPGDRYVVYVGSDGHSTGWSYFPGGSAEPKLSTTRADRVSAGGLSLPTRFDLPNGDPLVRITDVEVKLRPVTR